MDDSLSNEISLPRVHQTAINKYSNTLIQSKGMILPAETFTSTDQPTGQEDSQ